MAVEPVLEITMNGETLRATRGNTSLFTFIGELACYDHVFIVTDEQSNIGSYLFRNQEIFHQLASFLVENLYPMHLNLDEVADCDRNAFEHTMYTDIRSAGSFPDAWSAANGEATQA